ncbi:MAG: calcium/sodium antiporter [Planctomycetota bacterium]
MFAPLSAILDHPAGAGGTTFVGLVVLLVGGHWLVNGAVTIARRLGVSTLLVGLTIVAMGTSAPEVAFNVIAAIGGNTDLSFGNVIGSNIANIGLILGVAALYRPLDVHGRVIGKELPWLLVVSALMFFFVIKVPFADEVRYGFSRYDGGAMLLLFVLFMAGWIRMGRREAADPLPQQLREEAEHPGSVRGAVFLVLIGLACLIGGGKLSELGAVRIAEMLGLSQALIGLTIVAFATSLPELVTAIIACRKGHDDLAVGNVVGSNMFNLLLVLGLTAVVAPVALPGKTGWQDLGVMMGITCVMAVMSLSHKKISRGEGAALLAMYFAYMTWSVVREKPWL